MTPAALQALLKGDHENFIAAATPGGIEAQEKRGQIEQSFKGTLPKEGCDKAQMEKLGFVFTGEGKGQDAIFWECKFPDGWRKQATEHSMWSNLLDDKSRVRGKIFFKAAFYDYKAHMHLECRYRVESCCLGADKQPVYDRVTGKLIANERKTAFVQIEALDGATVLYASEIFPEVDWSKREEALKACAAKDAAHEAAAGFLTEKFPDWRNPSAYWD